MTDTTDNNGRHARWATGPRGERVTRNAGAGPGLASGVPEPVIDLHAHSTASDGTDSPAGLVAAAAEAGVDVLAITDHDTTGGWDSARAALRGKL